MKKVLAFLRHRWVVGFLGILAIGLLIWFIGPLIGFGDSRPFESSLVRLIIVGLIFFLWVIYELVRALRARKASEELSAGIVDVEAGDDSEQRSAEEVEALQERFSEAVTVLKKTGSGNAGLYDLPWYIIIGPPGSGKTTALVNSGLRFPLADRFGKEALRGVGGTRNCDWWFTEEAILLDTAGRYTTQDSQSDVDKAAWQGFLDLLKRYRKRRPINGVMVAISLSDIMTLNERERFNHARAIRERIQELDEYFGIRFPVYVMFTKSDLIAGFMEFFEDLTGEERAQVLGMTFELREGAESGTEFQQFGAEFDQLIERLDQRVMARLAGERDLRRRALIYGFVRQLTSLKRPLEEFITEVFRGSRFDQAPLLRGAYFTSGTQEGAPIDRLMGALARTFGLSQQAGASFHGQGRSYFITRLLQKVIFQESGIAGTNRSIELRRAWLQRGAYIGCLALLGLAIFGWVISYTNNTGLISDVEDSTAMAAEELAEVASNDRSPLAPLGPMNTLREMPTGYGSRNDGAPLLATFGLYQGDKLGAQSQSAYQRTLENELLPRIVSLLESKLDQGGANREFIFENLKVYLMLGSAKHYDSTVVRSWINFLWDQSIKGRVSPEEYAQLLGHLNALFTDDFSASTALDVNRIERARRNVSGISLEQRVYLRLKAEGLADEFPSFTIEDVAGPNSWVFERKTPGKTLKDGIEPLFTRNGYDQIFGLDTLDTIKTILSEKWVLKDDGDTLADDELMRLIPELKRLYFDEYADEYEELIFDVKLASFASADDAARMFDILGREGDSPLLLLIEAVARQTDFSTAAPEEDSEDAPEVAAGLSDYQKRFGSAVESRKPASLGRIESYSNEVEERFAELNKLVGPDGSGPIQYLQRLFADLAKFMSKVARESNGGQLDKRVLEEGQAEIQKMEDEARRQDNPMISEMLESAAGGSANIAFGGVGSQINAEWRSTGLEFCRLAIAGRYPIVRSSSDDVKIDDFGRFFGEGGVMQSFFDTYVADYVDTTRDNWAPRSRGGKSMGFSRQAIAMFQNADRVRESLFRPGDNKPYVAFDLTPISMDSSVNTFTLNLDGQQIEYFNGPAETQRMQWPGTENTGVVVMEMSPTVGKSRHRESGQWAWFRVMDAAGLRSTGTDQFELDFRVGERSARYQLTPASAINPFEDDGLTGFTCVETLVR